MFRIRIRKRLSGSGYVGLDPGTKKNVINSHRGRGVKGKNSCVQLFLPFFRRANREFYEQKKDAMGVQLQPGINGDLKEGDLEFMR